MLGAATSRLPNWLATLWEWWPMWCVLSINGLLYVIGRLSRRD